MDGFIQELIKRMRRSTSMKLMYYFVVSIFLTGGVLCLYGSDIYAQDKETIRFSVSRLEGVPNMDPHISFGDLAVHVLGHIYEGLTMNNPETGKVEPALALKWEWISPEILEVTLRENVTFHNGEKFDASSVKFSFEKIYHPEKMNFPASVYPQFAPQFKEVEIIDQYKVRLHFTKHNNTFINTAFLFKIVPEKYITEKGLEHFKKFPVGTGPFKVSKLEYNERGFVNTLYFEKNSAYWDPNYPKVNNVTYYYDISSEEGINMLLEGKLDAVANAEPRWFLELKKHNFSIQRKKNGALVWFIFNMHGGRKSPIQDIRVRQAIMHALNCDKMLRVVLRNEGRIVHQWAFPESIGYNKNLPQFEYNPDKAKQLLDDAGYPNGFNIHVVVEDTAKYIIKAIKSDLANIGITVTDFITDEETIIQIGLAKNTPDSKYRHHLDSMDIMIGDTHDYDFFHSLAIYMWAFHSSAILNFSNKPDQTGDKLWLDVISTFGDEEAREMWEKAAAYEYNRLGAIAPIEKYKFYATRNDLVWTVHSLWNLRNAYYK